MRRNIKSWQRFGRLVRPGRALLRNLPCYEQAILVAGCQRSGGTMLANEISKHPDVSPFAWSHDAELDAGLLLSGQVARPASDPQARWCFQTTYLNEQYTEYLEHVGKFKLIWLIREPRSVVYSMLYNWKRFALNELFRSCGIKAIPSSNSGAKLSRWMPALEKACYSYVAKANQALELWHALPPEDFRLVEYGYIVQHRARALEQIFEFGGLQPWAVTDNDIHTRSLGKSTSLADRQKNRIDEICSASYEQLRVLVGQRPWSWSQDTARADDDN